ncbi:MAG: hypothetical protein WAV41_02320 [Microgenomates group bacterium]
MSKEEFERIMKGEVDLLGKPIEVRKVENKVPTEQVQKTEILQK